MEEELEEDAMIAEEEVDMSYTVHRRLNPMTHDSQRSGPTERPYTMQQYERMAMMLRELALEFQHHDLLRNLFLTVDIGEFERCNGG